MIKYICDRCKAEFSPKNYFLEATLIKLNQVLMPSKMGGSVISQQQNNRQLHFCPKCTEIFESDFLHTEKSA